MGLLLIVYLALRWVMLGGLPLPGRPYIMPLSDPAFGRFLIEKIAYYTIGLIALVPVIPMGGRSFFAGRPGVFYGTLAAVIVILLVIWAVYRFRRALLWPVVWTACLIAPTMPLFASSHHLYLPSAGTVVLVAAGLAALGGVLRPPGRPIGRPRAWLCGMLLVTVALVLGAMSWASEFAYTRGTLVEDLVVEDTIRRGRAIHDGDYLFFINLPVVAYYVVPALEEALGVKNLKGHVLTFATDLTRMQAPSEVEILDAHRIRVRAPENERYFEGITGRTMLEVMEFSDVPAAGEPIDAGPFTVVPTVTDGRGIRELLFTYNERLDSPGYHFFFGSPQFLAYPLDVSRPTHAPKLPETRSAPGAMATAGHNSVESGRE